MTTFQESYGVIKYRKGISRTTPAMPDHHCEIGDCENNQILLAASAASNTGMPSWWLIERLHRDHCHEHGYIRGFACNACNLMMAYHEQFLTNRNGARVYRSAIANGYIARINPTDLGSYPDNGIREQLFEYLHQCPDCNQESIEWTDRMMRDLTSNNGKS